MRKPFTIIAFILMSFSCREQTTINGKTVGYTEKEILEQLDLAFNGIPSSYYPPGGSKDIKYNFFLDLQHGYCETAGSKIHLYADSARWAIVFEKSGYQNRGFDADIELDYIGNCISYPVDKYPERNYITNASRITLIAQNEYERIRNRQGTDMEQFELISPTADEVTVHGMKIKIEHDTTKYLQAGIKLREYDNSQRLVGYGDLVRYLNETNPSLISANEKEIRQHIPGNIPKLMTLDKFHFISAYSKDTLPSMQELYRLQAKVLVTRDTSFYKPTLKPNNHWTNWESGNL